MDYSNNNEIEKTQVQYRFVSIFSALMLVFSFVSCLDFERGNPLDKNSNQYQINVTHFNLEGRSLITGHEVLIIRYSDTIKKSSLSLTGTMAGSADVNWSTAAAVDDTLTIKPSGLWPTGLAQTLTVNCTSLSGSAAESVTFSAEVFFGVCVSMTGDDSNSGTVLAPKRTVQAGINYADALYEYATVRVSAGTYTADYNTTGSAVVTMHNNISVYGGYSPANFALRDSSNYETILQDTSQSGGSSFTPNRGVTAEGNISSSTVLSGFTVKSGKGTFSAAIFCAGTDCLIKIQQNKIQGANSTADGSVEASGIWIQNLAYPTVMNNQIDPGWCATGQAANCYGIYINSARIYLSENNITGGSGSGAINASTYAINIIGSNLSVIRDNNISCGTGYNERYCIYNFNAGTNIDSNRFYTTAGKYPIPAAIYNFYVYDSENTFYNNYFYPEQIQNNYFSFNGNYYRDVYTGNPIIDASNFGTQNATTLIDGNGTFADWNNSFNPE